jgi:hypothetical protein
MDNNMRAPLKILLTVVFLTIPLVPASAEDCDMIGCQGEVGYIFLHTRSFGTAKPMRFHLDRKNSCVATDNGPFDSRDLPLVNSSATIRRYTMLVDETVIHDLADKFQPDRAERIGSSNQCRVVFKEPERGNGLRVGNKVQILGYRTFVSHYEIGQGTNTRQVSQQLLFALVLVREN